MIEHPHSQYGYYTPKERVSKEDQLLREVRELRRIMEALAAHLGVTVQRGGTR